MDSSRAYPLHWCVGRVRRKGNSLPCLAFPLRAPPTPSLKNGVHTTTITSADRPPPRS
jgi:hypothetical protein